MRKIFKFSIITILVFICIFLSKRFFVIDDIPHFEYNRLGKGKFNNQNLKKNNLKTIFVYFSTECDDCGKILNDIDFLKTYSKKYNFLFIASENDTEKVKKFTNHIALKNLNIPILMDTKNDFASDFSLGVSISYPTMLLFSEKGKFIKKLEDYKELIKL